MKKHLHVTFASMLFIAAAIQAQVTITATAINPVVGEGFNIAKGTVEVSGNIYHQGQY